MNAKENEGGLIPSSSRIKNCHGRKQEPRPFKFKFYIPGKASNYKEKVSLNKNEFLNTGADPLNSNYSFRK